MGRKRLDALLFASLENIRYLCGFTGSDGALLVTGDGSVFLSDSRYEEQARQEVRKASFVKYKQKVDGLARWLRQAKVRRLGFEAPALSYDTYLHLQEKLPRVTLTPLSREIAGLRSRKETEEIEKIRRAIEIASRSFEDVLPRIKPAARERSLAEFFDCRVKRRGAEKVAFDTIVASGPRAALPHGAPSEKRLAKHETVVVDFGARFQGYHSDETKTLLLGRPDARQQRIYDLVRRAQEKALKAVHPGVSVRRIDGAAREVIGRAGYGEFFGHGTGHGVGLAIHEEPSVSPRGRGIVEQGMVITVEPGIYIPGWGGVRLENMVLVTARGCEVLTRLPKDLKENIIR